MHHIKSRGTVTVLFFLLSLLNPYCIAQCDLELVDVDLIDGTFTIAFNNTANCGGTGGPDGVSEIQMGFQALDSNCNAMNIGWDLPSGFSLSSTSNHPGWIYSSTSNDWPNNWTSLYDEDVAPPYYTGETVTFPLYNQYQSDCVDGPFAGQMGCELEGVLNYWIDEGYSIQAVIWQISYGPTMYASEGGWAEVGVNGDGTPYGTGLYEDLNFLDNWFVVGDCGTPIPEVVVDTVYVELPPDTVYIELPSDTVYYPVICYFYDTTYIYVTDTLIEYVELPSDTVYQVETVYEVDTIVVPMNFYFYDTTYIYTVDTVETYEYDVIDIDCETGLPCTVISPDCPIYIPNSFTPDNDGINDFWSVETDDCWAVWYLRVYSRSGDIVWESQSMYDIWLGGDEYYVPDGVYVYRLECSMPGQSYVINGHVTILR